MKEYKLWLAKLVTLVIITFIFIPFVLGALVAVKKQAGPKVSVIELTGIIEDATDILRHLYAAVADKDVKAIVLRIDSPGGAVAPSEEIYYAVKRLKAEKPIVVSMGSLAASGGLYSAVGASKILCQPGTQTGSIGVIMQIPNFTNIAKTVGFDMVTVKSGDLKDTGNQFRPMTELERKFLEGTANKVHNEFIRAVAEGRNLPDDKVRQFADGRVLLGTEAKTLGLVDGFGDVFDAGREALALAKITIPADSLPNLVFVNQKKNFFEKVLDSTSSLPSLIHKYNIPTISYLAY